MNAFLLIIPLFLIRFGLLGFLDRTALRRAASFAPLEGGEKTAYLFYQGSNAILILYPLLVKIGVELPVFLVGLGIYATGVVILILSTVGFARPDSNGLNTGGIYKISRNPMYVGYFVYFLGCAVLARSVFLLLTLLVFQLSAHWIVLSEERWCVRRFGEQYLNYMSHVRRYLGVKSDIRIEKSLKIG